MTEPEFATFFHTVLQGLPDDARESIMSYCADNNITTFIHLHDEHVDSAERRYNHNYPSAITLYADDKRHFAFRPFISDAPTAVLTAIVQHELVHAFLQPYLHPIDGQKPISAKTVAEIERYKRVLDLTILQLNVQLPPGYDWEEDLVAVINTDWGANEDEARAWVAVNANKRFWRAEFEGSTLHISGVVKYPNDFSTAGLERTTDSPVEPGVVSYRVVFHRDKEPFCGPDLIGPLHYFERHLPECATRIRVATGSEQVEFPIHR